MKKQTKPKPVTGEVITPDTAPPANDNFLVKAEPQLDRYIQRNRLTLPASLDVDQWESIGMWLLSAQQVVDRSAVLVRLLRADWWRYGCTSYGEERATQAEAIFGVSARTIRNDASELTNVADDCREVDGATFEILAGVRHAPRETQRAIVEQAVAEGWGKPEVEARSRPDGANWQRAQLVRRAQNAYNLMDDEARAMFDQWYAGVTATAQTRKATKRTTTSKHKETQH